MLPILDKARIIAPVDFNRWLVPPAALCIHLCIGMAYGFSVFWLPMTTAVGIDKSIVAPAEMAWYAKLVTVQYDWDKPILGWIYTLFFVFLGGSAACFGKWLEHAGPRKAGFAAALCWSGGLALSALGVYWHQLWIVWLGAGVIGGIGLGLGYISPVSTLIKWFPDRRGMATGMAIMGFGGGALIGSPLADKLIKYFAHDHSVGVWETLLVLSVIYLGFMMLGAFAYRVPPEGWQPKPAKGVKSPPQQKLSLQYVPVSVAWRTPQFWLLWCVLCLNVSAGIGVIGMASTMLQEIFGGRLIGVDAAFEQLHREQLATIATVGAGFTGFLSLFNIGGRFFWASLSDYLGRQTTYTVFFLLGGIAYVAVPWIGQTQNVPVFVGVMALILTMYGGGFAAVPAYLADLFGTQMVGAIHGRLLTAWSVAGVLGPVLVNYLNAYQIQRGLPSSQAYDRTMYLLAGMLVVGFVCNLCIRPVRSSLFVESPASAGDQIEGRRLEPAANREMSAPRIRGQKQDFLVLMAFWGLVLFPLAWGIWQTLMQAKVLLLGPVS